MSPSLAKNKISIINFCCGFNSTKQWFNLLEEKHSSVIIQMVNLGQNLAVPKGWFFPVSR